MDKFLAAMGNLTHQLYEVARLYVEGHNELIETKGSFIEALGAPKAEPETIDSAKTSLLESEDSRKATSVGQVSADAVLGHLAQLAASLGAPILHNGAGSAEISPTSVYAEPTPSTPVVVVAPYDPNAPVQPTQNVQMFEGDQGKQQGQSQGQSQGQGQGQGQGQIPVGQPNNLDHPNQLNQQGQLNQPAPGDQSLSAVKSADPIDPLVPSNPVPPASSDSPTAQEANHKATGKTPKPSLEKHAPPID